MKLTHTILLLLTINASVAQKIETITIPKGVVYNYCDDKLIEKAKKIIANDLSNSNDYKILQDRFIVGPMLWKTFKDNENIQKIKKGKVEFHVDGVVLDGKMSQDLSDSKIIWDEFKNAVSQDYKIRKANEHELKYYWSVISFDIDEPLLIIETKEHNYILNLLKKNLKLLWLDEAPKQEFKSYQNGEEIDIIPEGIKETKLEKVILLDSDEKLKENISVEDIQSIIEKTNRIFDELFAKSKKSGKIMIQFVLNKKDNEIQFSVKDDLDLEIMKVFEKRINDEIYPNSKKESIKFQIIYKVNSFNDN